MNLEYIVFDGALAVLAFRSIWVLRGRAPWTRAGWAATIAYCIVAMITWSGPQTHRAAPLTYWFVVALAAAFIVAAIRDEPQAEPWWWPSRIGRTRAERFRR